ncbi:MAG: zinc-dependent metalloprotease [Bacteroidota bacterium]
MKKSLIGTLGLFIAMLLVVPSFAQDGPKGKKPSTEKAADAKNAKGGAAKDKKKKGKTFEDIITDEAISDEGLFNVHKVGAKYYFEIPNDLLDKDILMISRIAGHVKGLNFGGAGMKSRPEQIIKFQKHEENLLLRYVTYDVVADDDDKIALSVKNNNIEPILQSFKIETQNADSTGVVIDVTGFFTSDVDAIGPMRSFERRRFGVRSLDKRRSVIDSIKAYPRNVEVRHTLTYNGNQLPDNQVTNTLTIGMNQSFILLPDEPWQPRLDDVRVDYFDIDRVNYSSDAQKANRETFITRWRLEPKDPEAYFRGELVEPIKPIVYYLDRGTPEKWRKYLKQGVEDWQVAFEAAGFKNAIIAKDPPTVEEDPEWSPEDVRYSVIRYVATEIQNAQGPHVHDPRTGEIIESDIIWYHNVMNLLRNWFFIQTAAVNKDAQKVKFTDEIMGELIRFVAAHEVGHTLGFPHNFSSSVAYPVDSLRAPGFVQRMGVAPSIMDYARFNYVAQPEDEGAGVYPRVGPYDIWATKWGYRLIEGVDNYEDEKETLNQWIVEKADDPIYRFGQQSDRDDPSAQSEAVGDDAVYASDMGIENLKRITANLVDWSSEDAEDYSDMTELFGNVAGQFRRYMGHVSRYIGGKYEYDKTGDQEGGVYEYTSKEDQRRAINFLNRQIFTTPMWMVNDDILSRTGLNANEVIRSLQVYSLSSTFNTTRLRNMVEDEARNGSKAYTMNDLFNDTRSAIFSELRNGANPDIFRRGLHRAYIDRMGTLIASSNSSDNLLDIKMNARGTLSRIKADLEKASKKSDGMALAHYEDLMIRVKEAMNRKPSSSAPRNPFALTDLEEVEGCWNDKETQEFMDELINNK